jgi:histidine ammonia-lyase
MMLLRANSLAKGFSGVRTEIIDTLCNMLNRGVHPVIPSQGSVGASGDLAPLAHLALVLVGEGEAWFEGRRMSGGEAMKASQIPIIRLEAKEAISLINGTQAMLAALSQLRPMRSRLSPWTRCKGPMLRSMREFTSHARMPDRRWSQNICAQCWKVRH